MDWIEHQRDYEEDTRLLQSGWRMVIRCSFTQTNFDGSKTTWRLGPFRNEETAASAYRIALARGWTPPKWWQFWRWDDQPRQIPHPVQPEG